MNKIKIISIILCIALWLSVLLVDGVGIALEPQYSVSLTGAVLGVAYFFSFAFLTVAFCESKKIIIGYSIWLGIMLFGVAVCFVFSNLIPEPAINIMGIIIALLFIIGMFPLLSTIFYFGIPPKMIGIVLLLFYVLYFITRYIKKRKRKDDENEKAEDS